MSEFVIKLLVISILLKLSSKTMPGIIIGSFTNILGIALLIAILGSIGTTIGFFLWYASLSWFINIGLDRYLGIGSLYLVHFLIMMICSALVLNWFNKPGGSLQIKSDNRGLVVCIILAAGTTLVHASTFYFRHYRWLEFFA